MSRMKIGRRVAAAALVAGGLVGLFAAPANAAPTHATPGVACLHPCAT